MLDVFFCIARALGRAYGTWDSDLAMVIPSKRKSLFDCVFIFFRYDVQRTVACTAMESDGQVMLDAVVLGGSR